jgi:hypothetical protein
MQAVTLTIATIASVLAMILRPGYALSVYMAALFWYPSYLVVSIGSIAISVGRIVVTVLFLRCLLDNKIRSKFIWTRLDTCVAFYMAVQFVIYTITLPFSEAIENRMGIFMDSGLVYFVARLIVTDKQTLVSVIKCAGVTLVPLAVLGVTESITGWQPFLLLKRYCPWIGEMGRLYDLRWGLTRAMGPFAHSILFGCVFAMFLPLIDYLRREKDQWHILAYILFCIVMIGALSSMSSGPWVMVIVAILCLVLEKYKYLVKPLIILFIAFCIFAAIASNRPFYHVVVSFVNPLGGSGWHRAKLLDCAIEYFNEWWLVGYGDKDPGWGEHMGMSKTDVTNHFILTGVRFGMLGIIALILMLTTVFQNLIKAYRKSTNLELKSLYWHLGCLFVSTVVTWMSVSFWGQIMSLFYCSLGMTGSSFLFETQNTVPKTKVLLQHR